LNRLDPRLIIIDSDFMMGNSSFIAIGLEDPSRDLNAYDPGSNPQVPVGTPSRMALERMAQSLRYKVSWLNWETLAPAERKSVGDYFRDGQRRRFTCTLRPVE
jgi:hypothetical protein